jgi:uncharacterized repeat protein (TIGR04138 family)
MEKVMQAFRAKMEDCRKRNPRFSQEAYDLVFKALLHARIKEGFKPQNCSEHVTAREMVQACKVLAIETWGTSAIDRLKSWGIETSSDIGDLVFLLIENRILGKQPNDRRSDFDHLPFLNESV